MGEFHGVTHQVAELTDIRRRDKAGFDHIAHEKVTDPLGVFPVSLISLLRLGVLGMGKRYPASFFKNVEDRDPIFAR